MSTDRFMGLAIADSNQSDPAKDAVVIGIYGVQGSGKTYLLDKLKALLGMEHFLFYDGSEMISRHVPGGLEAFHRLEEEEKRDWRGVAIDQIGQESKTSGKAAIVTGHYMFWPEDGGEKKSVWTLRDQATFTHILYLTVPPKVLRRRRLEDVERIRPIMSRTDLHEWQETEKTDLRRICGEHGILYSVLPFDPESAEKAENLINNFRLHTEAGNLSRAADIVDDIMCATWDYPRKILVIDADRTLSAADTGDLFWKHFRSLPTSSEIPTSPKAVFSALGYTHTAFRQVSLLYDEVSTSHDFHKICFGVESETKFYAGMKSMMQAVAKQSHVGIIIATCGLGEIWEKLLLRERFAGSYRVIGSRSFKENFIVTPAVKAAVVSRFQSVHQSEVWVFGDSVLDLGMLIKADHSIVVVGDVESRSKTMDAALTIVMDAGMLKAHQVIMVAGAPPRLDTTRLPLIELNAESFLESILSRHVGLRVLHATDEKAAMILTTPMRDADISGPALRAAHHDAGSYLARHFLPALLGVKQVFIENVHGDYTEGFRLLNEGQTLIVALMRGGEPMALGVNAVFPFAAFLHAKEPKDLTSEHLQGMTTLILVDSVINTGASMIQFIQFARTLQHDIRIVVVAGVVQADAISILDREAGTERRGLDLVALRLSSNKFKGQGRTDTGNRLFNTIHME